MRSHTLKTQTLLRTGIVLVILVLLNVISVRIFGRLDVTGNGMFTLSQASRDLVGRLDDKVTVKAYFTEDLPSPYNNHRRILLDQLNEYRAYSNGNLQFEFIDPQGEKGEQEAQQQGIAPVQVQKLENDQFQVKRGFMGLVFQYEDRREVIPVVQNTSTLEYDISSTLKRLVTRTRKKVGFLTGNGEPGLNELSQVQQALSKQYDVTTVDLTSAPVPADVQALLVMAPANRLPDNALFAIDQFIMRGGKVAFLINRVEANLQNQFGRPLDVGLDDLLSAYGLRINADLVRDVRCAPIVLSQQQWGFQIQSQVPFPYLPIASEFNRDNMMVKELQGLLLYFASSVDTLGAASKGLTAEILMRSSERSGRQSGFFQLDPLRYQQPTAEDFPERNVPLAALVQGQFRSAFEGKPIPGDSTGERERERMSLSQNTRIVLVGDGDLFRDQMLGSRDNITFAGNLVDYLVDDAGLITIRSKDASPPPLKPLDDGIKQTVKWSNLVVPPLLVLGYGLFRWRMRNMRKKALSAH